MHLLNSFLKVFIKIELAYYCIKLFSYLVLKKVYEVILFLLNKKKV